MSDNLYVEEFDSPCATQASSAKSALLRTNKVPFSLVLSHDSQARTSPVRRRLISNDWADAATAVHSDAAAYDECYSHKSHYAPQRLSEDSTSDEEYSETDQLTLAALFGSQTSDNLDTDDVAAASKI
jgi:hypothetical protein